MSPLYMNDTFKQLWRDQDPFEALWSLDGEVYRQVAGRKTFRFSVDGKNYFAKLHEGVGWREIIKNLVQLRLPIISARNEWMAIQRLQQLNIDTMTAVAYGEKGFNPAARRSFIVTEALQNTISLEDYCEDWPSKRPEFGTKLKLIGKLAHTARKLHEDGMCHRDFYLCHFLMHFQDESGPTKAGPKLSLIDLHRALIKNRLSMRWMVKDLASLCYSAMHVGLSKRDLLRFMRVYKQKELRLTLVEDQKFWKAVNSRSQSMYKKLGSAG